MDWAAVSKAPSWCAATEAATDPGPTMLSFAGPSYAVAQLQDFSAGLVQRTRPATATARRGRALGAAGAGAGGEACSVDGCRSDLRRCREYHRRHKVCEAHSKTPVVVVRGQEQRFCQQCSRFHMLPEFDEGKRSCRKRLDGHNRRRRKPQHDAMDPRSFFPYHQVNQFSVYPRTFPIADRSADVLIHPLDHQRPFSISFSETIKAHSPLDDGSSILRTNTTNGSRCNGSYRTLDPECALSLLSSSLHLSPAIIPHAAGPSQFASSFARIASASQAATSAFASHGAAAIDNVLVPDGMFEDPSQALRFSWQE